jgi:hypothetical protein
MSIYNIQNFPSGLALRPIESLDPKDKQNDPKWSLAWARYIYSKYLSNESAITTQDYLDFIENRRYAMACQDTTRYKKVFFGSKRAGISTDENPDYSTMQSSREGYVDMNFEDIFSPMPKFILNIVGKLSGQEHDVNIEAQDEKSLTEKEKAKYKALAESYLKGVKESIQNRLQIQQQEPQDKMLPSNIGEADMFSDMGIFKLPYEIGMEMLNEYVMNVSDQSELKDDVIREILINNIAATSTVKDPVTGLIKNQLVETLNLIIENSTDRLFRDITWWGYQEYVSLGQIRECTGIDYAELLKLANTYKGVLGNPGTIRQLSDQGAVSNSTLNVHRLPNGNFTFDDFKVPVLFCRWRSYDEEYNTVRVREDGSEINVYEPYRTLENGDVLKPKVFDSEKRKTYKKALNTVYQCRWIVGSELVYDYGKMTDIPYNYALNRPTLGLNVSRLPGKSMARNAMPVLDQIYMTFLRLQNAIAKAAPPGLKIEYGALEGMTFDGKKFTPKDSLTLYSHTGSILYRFTPMVSGAPANSGKPIEELRGGLGTAGADAVVLLDLLYNQLAEVTGVDRISSISQSPTSEQTKGVTEIAVASTNDTLKSFYSTYLTIKVSQIRNTTLMLQSVLLTEEGRKKYGRIVGSNYIDAIVMADKYPPIEWGFKAVARPTEFIKSNVIAAAQQAMAGGKNGIPALRLSEYMFLVEHINTLAGIKFARAYIAYKEGERDKLEQEMQQRNIQMQNEGLIKLEQAKQQGAQSAMQMQMQLEQNKVKLQLEADLIRLEQTHLNTMDEIALQAQLSPKEEGEPSPEESAPAAISQ